MRTTRKIASLALLALALLLVAVALTAPMIAATAPAVLALGLLLAAWIAWPKRRTT